jgi:hypothetical protein
MWLMLGTILDVATTSLYFTWLLSFLTWGTDVDELTYRQHRPIECGY